MKKIGFIDYFIDEWHANNYPGFINASPHKDEFKVHMAWQEIAPECKKSLNDWCREFNVIPASSVQEVVDNCDCIVVLAPSNPEVHERLSEIPLKSGKPVYIDKPFAADLKTAKRIFSNAEKGGTPMMSSSALRFGSEIQNFLQDTLKSDKVKFAAIRGGGDSFVEYAIHQIEMLVMLMGRGAKNVMQCGTKTNDLLVVEYEDGRRASVSRFAPQPFGITVEYSDKIFTVNSMGDFFPRFINSMLEFFKTAEPSVNKNETLEIVRILEASIKALKTPDEWINID
jgi:predicted dehydrogenase